MCALDLISVVGQNVDYSISDITNALNRITVSDTPSQDAIAAKSKSHNEGVGSMVKDISSIYSNLLNMNTSTIGKLTTDLNNKRKRFALIRFLFEESRIRNVGPITFFTGLSHEQYNVLTQILYESSLPHFWRYLKICADIELGQCRHLPTRIGHAAALIVRIHNLPGSLFDMVQETAIPSLLMSSMQRLKGLPIDLLESTQRGMNWVIDDGPPCVSTDVLYHMPTLQVWNILSVILRLTVHDLYAEGRPLLKGAAEGADQGLDDAMARLGMTSDLNFQLAKIWHEKYEQIALLRLQSFTLDMTEAFGPGGAFLGLEVARTLPHFIHGIPQSFTILAPTDELRDEIFELLQQGDLISTNRYL